MHRFALSHKRHCFGVNNTWFLLINVKIYSHKSLFGTHQCRFVTIWPRGDEWIYLFLFFFVIWYHNLLYVNYCIQGNICYRFVFRHRSQSTHLRLNKCNYHDCVWANSRRDKTYSFQEWKGEKTRSENNPVYSTFLDVLTVWVAV